VARSTQLCDRLAEAHSVHIRRDCRDDLPAIFVDQSKMAQAISNLIRNAIEAMRGGGAVMVSVRHEDDHVIFRVADTGPGIHLEEGEDLFSPFFSKKEDGTGLGLSIVHRIVTAHNGTITFGNGSRGGAWFDVAIPTEEPASQP
jgi:signal transduction histidine kinase